MSVSDWSATADENTTVDGINIAEHCPAKNINNAIRSVMAALKNKCDTLDDTDNTLRRGAVIGEIRWYAMSTPPEGWLVCNGADVLISDYPALYNAIGKLFLPKDIPDPPGMFFLPNLMGKVPWGSTSVGTALDAGLPNIKGSANNALQTFNWSSSISAGSGAITTTPVGDTMAGTHGNGYGGVWIDFDASKSNSTYGNSTTVQPPALCLLPCIRYE